MLPVYWKVERRLTLMARDIRVGRLRRAFTVQPPESFRAKHPKRIDGVVDERDQHPSDDQGNPIGPVQEVDSLH